MKNLFLTVFFLSYILSTNAQDNNIKTGIHSISVSPVGFYFSDRTEGFGINLSVTLFDGNFKLYAGGGGEISFDGGEDTFREFNLLYGRELKINNWFGLDLYAGAG